MLQKFPYKRTLLSAFIFLSSSLVLAQHAEDTSEAQPSTLESVDEQPQAQLHNETAEEDYSLYSAYDWLDRMAESVTTQSFELVFVVSSDGKETLPYLWRKGSTTNDKVVEQLSLLNGPGFEQIALDGKVSIFEPGRTAYSVAGDYVRVPISDAFIRNPELLDDSYDAIIMGRNRIAGRMAQQLRIVSKDKTRFAYHLWIDEISGLLLKLNTYDLEGKIIEQVQITQLNVTSDVDRVFANLDPAQLPELRPTFSHQQRELAWNVSHLPMGMQIVKKSLHRIERTGQVTEYMLLSDGVVDVSVYLFEASAAFDEAHSWHSGQNAVVTKSDGRVQVTVLGKLPAETANQIANSIVVVE